MIGKILIWIFTKING